MVWDILAKAVIKGAVRTAVRGAMSQGGSSPMGLASGRAALKPIPTMVGAIALWVLSGLLILGTALFCVLIFTTETTHLDGRVGAAMMCTVMGLAPSIIGIGIGFVLRTRTLRLQILESVIAHYGSFPVYHLASQLGMSENDTTGFVERSVQAGYFWVRVDYPARMIVPIG